MSPGNKQFMRLAILFAISFLTVAVYASLEPIDPESSLNNNDNFGSLSNSDEEMDCGINSVPRKNVEKLVSQGILFGYTPNEQYKLRDPETSHKAQNIPLLRARENSSSTCNIPVQKTINSNVSMNTQGSECSECVLI